jgi:TrmH RNA methyltransferase
MTHSSRRIVGAGDEPVIGELKICGMAAVRARFQRDAGSILRLYFDYATSRKIGVMCKALAEAHKIYRCVEPPEMEKVAGTVHHGGIVAVVPAVLPRPIRPEDVEAWAARRESLLILDRIGNAHNLGALARSAAFFGIPRLVLTADPAAARPNDAAYRVAEGGLEELEVRAVSRLAPFLKDLADAGYEVIGAATRGAPALRAAKPEPPGASGARTAIVLGNEESGLAPDVAAACTRLVTIAGKGQMESLNVSVAGAVLMWECVGRKHAK